MYPLHVHRLENVQKRILQTGENGYDRKRTQDRDKIGYVFTLRNDHGQKAKRMSISLSRLVFLNLPSSELCLRLDKADGTQRID